ncbi:uncharacterized protein FMAN_09711 [Fusarium mangiferae]|uniref:Uncharacterized protein n=1 Tax=Fusarium mangiferae TaxID=192010 RepID=A0A1L7UFG8_FUSMA|nr:uncharacterized protein FMAN_09711 [Fusarium mangiferae]CVL07932.1 uncharacterized protein FMAN_09711 [Fusarium mangiferae]
MLISVRYISAAVDTQVAKISIVNIYEDVHTRATVTGVDVDIPKTKSVHTKFTLMNVVNERKADQRNRKRIVDNFGSKSSSWMKWVVFRGCDALCTCA